MVPCVLTNYPPLGPTSALGTKYCRGIHLPVWPWGLREARQSSVGLRTRSTTAAAGTSEGCPACLYLCKQNTKIVSGFKSLLSFILPMCVVECVSCHTCMEVRGQFEVRGQVESESVLSLHHVGPRDLTQVIRHNMITHWAPLECSHLANYILRKTFQLHNHSTSGLNKT